ncbi:hypothetical protein BBP00_00009211 [Phytophthora kernoviae]|uniref:Apple domain-containing protein n=1 Tax=Phytophthora kernoviae TaxID=325452 RepID=A0A3F2RDE5_9STRA|nr:hypothetical protein BBP00_00009211 [Phytophthora kernoviae]
MDYLSFDIGNVWAAKPGDCCALCRAKVGCRVFSWTNYQSGTCWLKGGKRLAFPADGVTSVGAGLQKVIFRGYSVLSKRKLQWFVDRGHVEDWVAPRFTTV